MKTRTLLSASYSAEGVSDIERDVSEAIDEADVPKDEDGFFTGTFHIQVTWRPTQERPLREQKVLECLHNQAKPIADVVAWLTEYGIALDDATRTCRTMLDRGEIVLNTAMELELGRESR